MWNSIRTFDDIRLEKTDDGIAKITINRPEGRNALNRPAYGELLTAFQQLHQDADVRCVILTGADPAFCSGYVLSLAEIRV